MHPQLLMVTFMQQQKKLQQLCTLAISGVQSMQDALKGDVGKEGFFVCVVVFVPWWRAANKLQTKDHPQQTKTNKQSFVEGGNT